MTTDTLQKFIFDNTPVRGELVEMFKTWQQIQAHHRYPKAVQKLLGEMLAAAALLSANLKFRGSIVMQIHGDGPVKLLVVECDAKLQMRAIAKLTSGATIDEQATLTELVNAQGQGRFVMTLDLQDKIPGQQPYQGIVPLNGNSIATVIEHYMMHSEQLETKLWLAADAHVVRGLLLQRLPHDDEQDEESDSWNRATILSSTLSPEELLSTSIQTLMQRLFWNETIRVFNANHPSFHCGCTREKVGGMLKMLGRAEVDTALAEMGTLGINCDFCGRHYQFDKVDCAQLFAVEMAANATQTPGTIKH